MKNFFSWLLLLAFAASSLAETIGDAKEHEFASDSRYRTYPILGNGDDSPRFLFQASAGVWADSKEGKTWSLGILLTPAGSRSGAVTLKEYLAFVDQCLDRFMKDDPDAKVDHVEIDLIEGSPILADIFKALRPSYEAMEKNPPPAPNEIMKGKAIEPPPGAKHTFVTAANDSAATQKLGAEMARRLGRKYVRVVNAEDHVDFDHSAVPLVAKTWKELLQDPHLGLALWTLRLGFIFQPQAAAAGK